MSESPMRPYSLATANGRLRIFGGDGDGEDQDNDKPKDSGKPAEKANDSGSGDDAVDARLRDLEERAAKADEDRKKAEEDRKKADQRAKDAEKKLTDKEREGMEEHERTEAERDDYKEKYEKLLEYVETTALDTEIMKLSHQKNKDGSPKYNWQDVEAVRAFIDKKSVKFDMDAGAVEGLEDQLKDIAKKRPYLLVPAKNAEGDDGGTPPPAGPATGNHPYGGSPHQRETDKQKLASKYKFNHLVVGGKPR